MIKSLPQSRKDKLIEKSAKLLQTIIEKNKETESLTPKQIQNLVDRVLKARTKELSGEISYLQTIFRTL